MSPIGKIFAVLNLILAAAFLGWASNALTASGKYKSQWEDAVAAHQADTQAWEDRENELNAKITELEQARSRFRQEKDDAVNDRDRYKADAEGQEQSNSELRASVDKIQGALEALVAQNKALEGSKSTAVQARQEAEQERDDALTAADEAARAQNEAEQRLTTARRDIAELRAEKESLMGELSSVQAKFDTVVAQTGISLDELVAQPQIEARVLEVNKEIEPGLVALNVGSEQDVKRGYVFHIYRGEQYLGKVRVENVRATMSTALIQGTYEGREIRQGDAAATRL